MPYADPERNREVIAEYHRTHAAEITENRRRERHRLKVECLTAYSPEGTPTCACCGETTLVFLTLDHVGGGGADERRAQGHRGGTRAYRTLRRAGWPPGYRVLCFNCNFAWHVLGTCPHQVSDQASTPSLTV